MATYYIRPTSDSSLQHTCSTGSSGYSLINESTADDDSKYIYNSMTGESSSGTTVTKSSVFNASCTIPSDYTINSAKLYIRAKRQGQSSSDSSVSGAVAETSVSDQTLSTSYTNYSWDIDISKLSRSGNTVSAQITTTTKIKAYKNESGEGRITQAYIQVEATAPIVPAKVYIKQNGTWVKKTAYQKVSGAWQILTEAPTGVTNGDKIVQK